MAEIIDKEFFFSLLIKASEGALSPEETICLNRCIHSDDSYAHLYVEFFDTLSGLNDLGENFVIFNNDRGSFNADILMSMLAQDEKTSPAVVIPKDDPETELIQKVVYKRDRSTINKTSLVIAMGSVAALVFLIVLVQLSPRSIVEPVATVKNCLGTRFADNEGISTGSRLENRKEMYCLKNGVLEIEFDYGASVVIEAPSIFRIDSPEKIFLNTGRVFARIPGSAKGFIIDTPNSSIIDLGTEFGVQVDIDGISSVHMFKGRASLIPGPKGNTGEFQMLSSGQARRVDKNGTARDIPFQNNQFVRGIDSNSGLAWRGQNVSLADIAGGGNGFGTGHLNYGILIDTGMLSKNPLYIIGHIDHHPVTKDFFRAVPEIAAVDGIFIPDGGAGKVVVSSQGHVFADCPDTCSKWCVPVINGAQVTKSSEERLRINNQAYGTPEKPGLFLHANIGITYDLDVIRRQLPENVSLTHFRSIGSAQSIPTFQKGQMDIWILVDGQVRLSKTNMISPEIIDIDIPLNNQDRFLSLVITDGIENLVDGKQPTIDYDWFLFGMPELITEAK